MATGFAAYLLFMKSVKEENGKFFGKRQSEYYLINDERAGYFNEAWKKFNNPDELVKEVLGNQQLWDFDLTTLGDFQKEVAVNLRSMIEKRDPCHFKGIIISPLQIFAAHHQIQ